MSMTSADLRSLLTLVYKLVFLSVGLYMDLSGRLGVNVFDTLSKAVGGLLGGLGLYSQWDRWFLTEKCECPSNTLSQQTSPIARLKSRPRPPGGADQPSRHPV